MSNVVAIGALGGSGTRAIAQILIEAGIYMGDDLNVAYDNLIFTRLFKNPYWYTHSRQEEMVERLDTFNQYMELDRLSLHGAFVLIKASLTNPTFRENKTLIKNTIRKITNTPKKRIMWGWKEPNTQLYIDEISSYFPRLKYIHVVRHGLDMAFSKNKQQLLNWGSKYDLHLDGSETDDEVTYKQMEYWVKSTQDSICKGEKLGDRFLLINHSTFCQRPKEQIDRLIQFLGIKVTDDRLSKLYQIPKEPSTLGRYRVQDLTMFSRQQIDFVKALGFNL